MLRRDNHTCRYCGATAPEVKLAVDHVIPVALGGFDEPSNLVTACVPCNAGKSSISPDSNLVADIDQRAALWRDALIRASEEFATERIARAVSRQEFLELWNQWTREVDGGGRETNPLPNDWKLSVDRFEDSGLNIEDFDELIDVAMLSRSADKFTYFCGCAWTRVKQMQQRALELVDPWS
ncbi:hypothetical protein CH289_07930 [Rhodococcus sp. RS1C4]|nr:hypothetical protein CH289_07930 [Rhodococcus sp. RS1C4]